MFSLLHSFDAFKIPVTNILVFIKAIGFDLVKLSASKNKDVGGSILDQLQRSKDEYESAQKAPIVLEEQEAPKPTIRRPTDASKVQPE
jgi:hypothetical protein